MKNLIALLVFYFALGNILAQGIDISESARAMHNGTYNSFLFELPDVNKKDAEDHWKKFIGDFKAKTKYEKKTKLWFSDNAQMPRLSRTTVDVYARIIEDSNPKKQTSVIVWFDLGNAYVNSEADKEKVRYARDILTEYAMATSRHQAEAVVKAEEKTLKDLESDLKKLRKDNSSYHKEIEQAKEAIAKMEKNIQLNERDQEDKEQKIGTQKKVLTDAKDQVRKFN